MLNIKKLLTKILEWIKNPEITNSTDVNTFYSAVRTDSNTGVNFGIGSGGGNHGIYSDADNWIIYQTENGAVGIGGNGTKNASGSIYFKGTAFNSLFVHTEHTLTSNLTITSGNTSNATYTVTKSGYTPVGVVGWRTINGSGSGGSYALCFGATLSSASSGSGTVNIGIRATGAVTKCTLLATVLWIKNI